MTHLAYLRVSTDGQTLAPQRLAIAHQYPDAVLFEDDGVSGSTAAQERPGMAALLATAQPGDTVVVYSLSRCGRSTMDVLELLDVLAKRGIAIRSLTEPLDTSTPVGRLLVTMLAAFAQLERDMIAERTKVGMAAAKARGSKIGRQEQPGRRAIVEALLTQGKSCREIALETGFPLTTVRRLAALTA